jgi:hypothetical protein
MATRVAQQYAQVVGEQQQDGELRVRRLYAEVLVCGVTGSPQIYESANNAMSLVGTAVGWSCCQHVDDTINMTVNAVGVRVYTRTASNTMNLISLGGRALSGTPTSNMTLAQLAAYFNLVDDRKPAYNTLNLVQTVTSLSSLEAEHDLGLAQTVNIVFPIKPNITSVMGLSQSVSTPHRAFISHTMSMYDTLKTPLTTQNVSHTLNLVQDSPIGNVANTLNLSQQVSFGFSQVVTQNLGVTDSLDLQGLWVRSATHDNFLGHALTWYEDTPCGRKQYTPFQGENTIPSITTSPPRNDLQDPQGDTNNFSLYQPYLGVPTEEVILRNPELDNRDRNAYTRISEETRGGKVIVYADPDWPKVRTLAVTIVGLTETQVDDLHDFMQTTVGQEIGLNDWEGRLWKGFIVNPNEPATQDGRGRWTISFEFQGEMLEVEQPGNEDGAGMVMNMTQSVSAVIV